MCRIAKLVVFIRVWIVLIYTVSTGHGMSCKGGYVQVCLCMDIHVSKGGQGGRGADKARKSSDLRLGTLHAAVLGMTLCLLCGLWLSVRAAGVVAFIAIGNIRPDDGGEGKGFVVVKSLKHARCLKLSQWTREGAFLLLLFSLEKALESGGSRAGHGRRHHVVAIADEAGEENRFMRALQIGKRCAVVLFVVPPKPSFWITSSARNKTIWLANLMPRKTVQTR